MFSDIQSLEIALPKAERAARTGDKEAKFRVSAIQKYLEQLNKYLPLRLLQLDETEAKAISSFGLMSAKPILYIANVDETDLEGKGELVMKVREFATNNGARVVPVCAKLEAEIAELDEPDRSEMLAAVGLEEPALQVVAREAYRTLGLQSYFTAGEKEVRAWTIPVGATAPQAAGVIHTDFEKGFIRCETYGIVDLEQFENEKEIRANGRMRTEGKTYVVQDGDICHFLFNS